MTRQFGKTGVGLRAEPLKLSCQDRYSDSMLGETQCGLCCLRILLVITSVCLTLISSGCSSNDRSAMSEADPNDYGKQQRIEHEKNERAAKAERIRDRLTVLREEMSRREYTSATDSVYFARHPSEYQ